MPPRRAEYAGELYCPVTINFAGRPAIVNLFFRSSGASISKAKEEFTTEVMANKNVQGFAADAATAAAR